MKTLSLLMILGGSLIFTISIQAAPAVKVEKICPSKNDVQRMLDNLSLTDIKNQMARKLVLPRSLPEGGIQFDFENQQISRVVRNGDRCEYFTSNSSNPFYVITLNK